MRSETRVVLLAVALLGCQPAPKPEDGAPKRPPPSGDAASLGTETTTFKPGSRRALIFTWSSRFPVQVEDWLLEESLYQKTDDAANAWKVLYATKDRKEILQVAACEYVSADSARLSYENVLSKVGDPSPLSIEGCEQAAAGSFGDHALALARSSRYLFIFDRPRAKEIGEPVVKTIVKACLTEPRSDDQPPDAAPVASPARNGG
jgi:hypothetical protein